MKQSSFRQWVSQHFLLIGGTGILLASAGIRWLALSQTPFLNGWDGYFYVVQLKALFEEGQMHSSDVSLIYLLMGAMEWAIGNYELTYKLAAALVAGMFSLAFFRLSYVWSGSKSTAAIFGSITLFSPHLTYFASQYPKNLLGVFLFLFFLESLARENKKDLGDFKNLRGLLGTLNIQRGISFLLLILNFFGHRMTIVLSLMFGCLDLLAKKIPRKWLIALVAIGGGIGIAGFFLPGVLHLADLDRFEGEFSSIPQFAPWSFYQAFGPELITNYWLFELLLTAFLFLLTPILLIGRNLRSQPFMVQSGLLWLICLMLIFPFFVWSLEGFGYRMFLVFVLLVPLIMAPFVSASRRIAGIIGMALLGLSCFSWKNYSPELHDPPYQLYDSFLSKANQLENPELIIAHKSLAEFVTFRTATDAMPWIPEYEIPEGKLWRIGTDIRTQEVQYFLDDAKVISLSPNYFLIQEKDWQELIIAIKKEGDSDLLNHLNTWRNPYRVRPFYLHGGKNAEGI